jgi:PhnB protein
VNPIPPGFRTVTPYLVAEDGPALLEFAKQAFGGEETFRIVGRWADCTVKCALAIPC